MAGELRLEVVTPDKAVVSDVAKTVVAPGAYGEFGVLPGHTTFLTTLQTGMIRYQEQGGGERIVFVHGGFAEVSLDTVTVLAEAAERRKDIDVERAKAAVKRAEERLTEASRREDIDFKRAQAALQRAMARLRVAQTR
jgi:F-type H+-transporting ATPase subunit epsilon